MRRTLPKLFLIVLLLVVLPVCASAASFRLADYRMDIAVETDGAGLFTETLTYGFDGEYNGILMTIRHKDVSYSQLRIYGDNGEEYTLVDALDGVPGTYTAVTENDKTEIKVFSPGYNGNRVFTVTYRIGGFALRYRDTARINYMLLQAKDHYDNAIFTITLPGSDSERIEPFFHGAVRQDMLRVRGGVIDIASDWLDDGNKVEVQALFPAEWLPDAKVIDQDIYQEALDIEARIVREAEAAAERAAQLEKTMRASMLVALGVYIGGFTAAFYVQRSKYGLSYPILSTMDDVMLRGIPAAAAQILRDKQVSSSGLSATLLELTERGALTMRTEDGDTYFTPALRPAGLWPHQEVLLDWLFADGQELCLGALDVREDYPQALEFNKNYGAWKTRVQDDVYAQDWQFKNGGKRFMLSLSAVVLGLALSMALLRLDTLIPALVNLPLTVLFGVLFAKLRRLTDEGEKRLATLNGFVETYQDLLETNPSSVLGRAPLIMALGYMKPLATWVDEHPAYSEPSFDYAPIWMASAWHHSMMDMDRTVREAQSHNASAQDPNSSDSGSSGGGGGFSGGSGGGSSHGAW